MTAAWRASRRPGTGQQRRARRRGVQSLAQAHVFNIFGWLAEAALKSEKPADLPVQLSVKYETVLNMTTAKALGLDVPTSILLSADEPIE